MLTKAECQIIGQHKQRSFRTVVACLLVLLSFRPASAEPYFGEARLARIEPPFVADRFSDRGDGVLWEKVYRNNATNYVRLHFENISSATDAKYSVVIRNRFDDILALYDAAAFSERSDFWSGVLFEKEVRIQVQGAPDLSDLRFIVKEVAYQQNGEGMVDVQSVMGKIRPIGKIDRRFPGKLKNLVRKAGKSIVKLYLVGRQGTCTGVLVSQNKVLTNFHCLQLSQDYQRTSNASTKSAKCGDITIQLYFDQEPLFYDAVTASCLAVLYFNSDLDYALIEISESDADAAASSESMPGFLRLSDKEVSGEEGSEVFAIHHPLGRAKSVSFGCNAYAVDTGALLEHDCTTFRGSSGAPLIGEDLYVIGLHFSGAYDPSLTGESAYARDPVQWNLAIPAHAIAKEIGSLLR